MKLKYLVAMILALSVSATSFAAEDGEALFKQHKCKSCHKLDKKTVGPSVKEISGKYANDEKAVAMLEERARNGSKGVWGKMPMPKTKASVSDADLKTMVGWILSHQ
ncbi:MAG: c-type cytochrome [Gallionella sp.]